MKKIIYLFLIVFSFSPTLFSSVPEEITTYLLPDDLPIKIALDEMFRESRFILNSKTLKKAGFNDYKPRKFTRIIVTKHDAFPGYVFKIYLDAMRYKSDEKEYVPFLNRIEGARLITLLIEERGLSDFFKVPKKWIYQIPKGTIKPEDFAYKNFILVEEDMDLLEKQTNIEAWKSPLVTADLLISLYMILKEIGLRDCAKIENIPFSVDGKIAFIDTESFGFKSVPFKRLKKSLSLEMKLAWESIIQD